MEVEEVGKEEAQEAEDDVENGFIEPPNTVWSHDCMMGLVTLNPLYLYLY